MPSITVENGKVFVQVWHIRRNKWKYIPIKKWLFMTDKQRNKYCID